MTAIIRTLPQKDAEILARSIVSRKVSKGYVEAHGLRWRADSIRTWELGEEKLGRTPIVDVRIDELDLSVVFIEVPNTERTIVRAISTQPQYTNRLSLCEHQKLKDALKEKAKGDRLSRMEDREAYGLRLEYYAALGRANDPVSRRRLEKVRDQLAARRLDLISVDRNDALNTEIIESPNLELLDNEAPIEVIGVPVNKNRGKKASKASAHETVGKLAKSSTYSERFPEITSLEDDESSSSQTQSSKNNFNDELNFPPTLTNWIPQ